MNDVSVILRVRNEERWVGYTIQSIIDIFQKPQIIVVDNNSNDSSMDIVSHFKVDYPTTQNHPEFLNIKINDYTPGKSINLAVNKAKSEYIMIISSHCVIKKLNFHSVKNNLKKYIAIFGKQIPIWNGKRINKKYIWSNFSDQNNINPYSENENRFFFHNAFSFFLTETLISFPFDENLVGKEDRYWANDRINHQNNILYDSELIVEHHYTENGSTWKNI